MMEKILLLVLLTFIPLFELRVSIPYGIFILGLDWRIVALICIATNIVVGMLVYFALDKFVNFVIRFGPINRAWNFFCERVQRKNVQKYVDKFGTLGIAIFIGVPLPGTGAYTGALAAYLLRLGYKRFAVANFFGVLIAGVAVTALCLLGMISAATGGII